jgi:fructose-bisphosphate aldolase class I
VNDLDLTAAHLTRTGHGILAADESIRTMSQRLEAAGVAASAESRRDYRALLLTTPRLSDWVTGMIVCDETLRQTLADGTPFPRGAAERGIAVGIKVDTGVSPLPFAGGGVVTEGLDGLRGRLEEYRALGATFAKWRAVLDPRGLDRRTIRANAHALARYAALCQETRIVPIVEPEVLMDGSHEVGLCQALTANVLQAVFEHLDLMGVDPAAIVLKPNMILAGRGCPAQTPAADVARRTVKVLQAAVPPTVPGIAFLSGGQPNAQACEHLTAINREGRDARAPWSLTFSFGRALVDDALRTWHGDPAAVEAAQAALAANCARAASASAPGPTEHPDRHPETAGV